MEGFENALQEISQFRREGQIRLALDKLSALVHSGTLTEMELPRVYEAYGLCYDNLGDMKRATDALLQAVCACKGPMLEQQRQLYSEYLLLLHHLPGISAEELRQRHWQYNDFFADCTIYTHQKKEKEKLRIGYISPDFREHVMSYFSIQMLACRDCSRYEIFCYMTASQEDETTKQMKALADGWRNVSALTNQAAAEIIYKDGIDILFDLAGHSGGGRTLQIAGHKPAPIQISGIGYFNTTGLAAMDYFLTDVYCDPVGAADHFFREKLLRLPKSHLCYTPSETAVHCSTEHAIHEGIVFGSFNSFSKINEEVLDTWREILRRVPGSRLVLKNTPNFWHQEWRLEQKAQRAGFSKENLEIRSASRCYMPEYLGIDIALDTWPYPGGGTTCDALYMGVPVVSLAGQRHGSRFGYSLLSNAGIGQLTAFSKEEYIEKAVALAKAPQLLAALHRNLRNMLQKSPVMDGKQYVADLERLYEKIWQDWLGK